MGRYGSGSLFQRGKKGIWYYQAWVNGKQLGPYSSRSTDRKKAQLELDKLIGKRARGELTVAVSKENVTVSDLVRDYLSYADEKLRSAKIIRWVLHANVSPKLGSLRLEQCNIHKLREYRLLRKDEGADDVTCNRELSYLRAAWRRALKYGNVSSIPYFPIVQEDNARQGFLEEHNFLRFLGELVDDLKPFAVCAYYGGMRRGEILALRRDDVDLENLFISIRREIAKNKEPRLVPVIDGSMRQWLQWAMDRFTAGQSYVITWAGGKRMTARSIYEKWRQAAERAGLNGFIPHDCRRSASRNMRNEGISQKLRMEVLGHKTDSMDRRYGITDKADIEMVREKMNRRFKKRV